MAYIFGTPEWLAEYWKAVQGAAEYEQLAKILEGTAALCMLSDPDAGLDEGLCFFGELKSKDPGPIRIVSKKEARKADFVFTGEYIKWKGVTKGDVDPVREAMRGHLKITGKFLKLMQVARHIRVSTVIGRLVGLASSVETLFPDELSPGDIEKFKVRVRAAPPFESP